MFLESFNAFSAKSGNLGYLEKIEAIWQNPAKQKTSFLLKVYVIQHLDFYTFAYPAKSGNFLFVFEYRV